MTSIAVIEKVADELQGQCVLSLEDVIERDQLIFDTSDYAYLDTLIFQCECCDWWCEINEMVGDQICEDCA